MTTSRRHLHAVEGSLRQVPDPRCSLAVQAVMAGPQEEAARSSPAAEPRRAPRSATPADPHPAHPPPHLTHSVQPSQSPSPARTRGAGLSSCSEGEPVILIVSIAGAAALIVVAYHRLRTRSPETASALLRAVRELAAT